MYRSAIIIVTSLLCVLSLSQTQARSDDKAGVPTIIMTKLAITDKSLKLRYEIRNESEQDIWICENIDIGRYDFEAFLAEDGQTLLIRRRFDAPQDNDWLSPHMGLHVRLRPGQNRTESLLLPVPISRRSVFVIGRHKQGLDYATRLAMEIGYYEGDLTGTIYRVIEEEQKIGTTSSFGQFLTFNWYQEQLKYRDEQALLLWNHRALKGARVSTMTVDGLRIPCISEDKELYPPRLRRCTSAEIQFQPSILEYCFPHAKQQSLLSPAEKVYLQSLKTITVENQGHLKALARGVSKGVTGGILTEHSSAHVTCYRDEERTTAFTIHDDMGIETEDKRRFRYWNDLPNMSMFAPQTTPFGLRVQCADNLANLWHQLRWHHKAEKTSPVDSLGKSENSYYPMPIEWCTAMVRASHAAGNRIRVRKPYKCPSASEGKCHYAMNAKCKPESPADMVLLFETEAGWNRHGGPDLFTFENHDPKGGCVLLNDGTVKFIRMAEELRRLRWE